MQLHAKSLTSHASNCGPAILNPLDLIVLVLLAILSLFLCYLWWVTALQQYWTILFVDLLVSALWLEFNHGMVMTLVHILMHILDSLDGANNLGIDVAILLQQ